MGIPIAKSFVVKAPAGAVWAFLIDPYRVASCLPGAAITGKEDDRTFTGTMTVKVGPVTAAYRGKLRFEELDEAARRAQLSASGQETRGKGGADMRMQSRVAELSPGETEVTVESDVNVVGVLAQFGRGMIQDVSDQMFQRFTEAMRRQLEAPATPATPEDAALAAGVAPAPLVGAAGSGAAGSGAAESGAAGSGESGSAGSGSGGPARVTTAAGWAVGAGGLLEPAAGAAAGGASVAGSGGAPVPGSGAAPPVLASPAAAAAAVSVPAGSASATPAGGRKEAADSGTGAAPGGGLPGAAVAAPPPPPAAADNVLDVGALGGAALGRAAVRTLRRPGFWIGVVVVGLIIYWLVSR